MTEEDLKEYEEAGTTALERQLIVELRRLQLESKELLRMEDTEFEKAMCKQARADERAKCAREAKFREENIAAGARADERKRIAAAIQKSADSFSVKNDEWSGLMQAVDIIEVLKDPL